PDEDIDLARLAEAPGFGRFRVGRMGSCWAMPFSTSWGYDEWAQKLHKGCFFIEDKPGVLYMDIARSLDPRLGSAAFNWSQIIHVPFNFNFPLERQWDDALPVLRGIRTYLYRFTKKRPPRSKSANVYRNVYVFLLAEMKCWSVAKIGVEVFP